MKNLEEFLAKTKPGAKKSRLHEFLPALKSLQERKYTLKQIQDFLKENEVEVSVAWLSAFLRTNINSNDRQNLNVPSVKKRPAASTSGENPLRALSGKPKEGEFNPIPPVKIEIDNS
ncbi:MAG: hypothetical protein PHH47_06565 [Gallionella sp.]|nr:hypothetical protein [Gallionella sp.]MDD4947791.1 hypothetical protein [Gallionella sp.]